MHGLPASPVSTMIRIKAIPVLFVLILSAGCLAEEENKGFIEGIVDAVVPNFVQNLLGGGNKETSEAKNEEGSGIYGKLLEDFKDGPKLIHPGTKWCGSGNKSDDYNDLGTFSETDSCCRLHDMCPDSIGIGETKHGLKNTGFFKRSACECDMKFHKCLRETNSLVATEIGITYFTILGPQCFQEDYPVTGCKKEKLGKCIEYEFDKSGEKRYQWFDNPRF